MQSLVFCLVVLFALAFCQSGTQFQANFKAYNDPTVQGIMTGIINYDLGATKLSNVYNVTTGTVSEYFDFTAKLRYLYCTVCEAETITSLQPAYDSAAGTVSGGAVTINGRSCTQYSINDVNNPVQTLYSDAGGLPCRAIYRTTGKTIDFTNVVAINPNAFTVITSWNCPAQQCNKMIDFVFIFDESGSIVPADFQREKQFGISVAQNYVFGPQNSGFALVQFSGDARFTIHMTYIQTSFLNSMNSVYQRGGSTCIGCGLQYGQTELQTNGRTTAGVGKVFIMLTDGQNNVDTGTFNQVLAGVRAANIIVFTIGVGPAVDSAFLSNMATVIPGVTTSFPAVPSFSALQGIVNNLVISTCINIPGTPCGQGCQGFCSCQGTCVCPSSCDDGNPCTDDSCASGTVGCIHTTHVCSDGNYCTQDLCNPASGCYFPLVVCNSPDACHNSTCDPNIGCQFPVVNCNLDNPCFIDSCNPATGCQHTAVNCDKCKYPTPVVCPAENCFNNVCNVTNGLCDATPINCDDDNACTTDGCDLTTGQCTHNLISCDDGNACTHDFCDIQKGCYHVDYNVSTDCNDYTVCTIDTCDPKIGCVHTPLVCDDNLTCTTNNCSATTGCYYLPLNCLSNPRIAKFLGTCYQALCAESKKGCYLNQLPGTTIDSCGVCNGNNQCVIVPLPSNVPYVIGGALLAVIIIGSIIVCVALGAFGGKKGYDIWLAHRSNMSGATSNPLYKDQGLTGTSALYSPK